MSAALFFNEAKLRPEYYEISDLEAIQKVKQAGHGFYLLTSRPDSTELKAIYQSIGKIWKSSIKVVYSATLNTFLWQDCSDKRQRTYYSLMSLIEESPRLLFPCTPWASIQGFVPRYFKKNMLELLSKEQNGSYFITEAEEDPYHVVEVFFLEKKTLCSELMMWSHPTFQADLKKLQEYTPLRKPICLSSLSKTPKRSMEPSKTSPSKAQKTK